MILILDNETYKNKEKEIYELFKKNGNLVDVIYTAYEDALIRKVCKWKYIGEILLHLLYWFKSFRYALTIMRNNKPTTIICVNPIVGSFLGLLNREKKFKIILCGFIFEPKSNKLYYNTRKLFVNFIIKGIYKIVVYSKHEIKYYKKIFKNGDFEFVQYGIDYESKETYINPLLKQPFIVSGGRSNRDYKTLLDAYQLVYKKMDIALFIATRPVVVQGLNTSGVTILKDVVIETFGSMLEQSLMVIVPLADRDVSAGHLVILEALQRNRIVIVNKIDSILDYVSEDQVVFFESENVEDLCNKIIYVLENYKEIKAQYCFNTNYYKNNFTFICYIERLIKIAQ